MRIILFIVVILTANVYAANYDAAQYVPCDTDLSCEIREGAVN